MMKAEFMNDGQQSGAKECQIVWNRHVRAVMAGDVDAIMSNFTDRSAVITLDAVFKGEAEIRAFFEKLLGVLDRRARNSTVMNVVLVHDDTLIADFTIGSIGRTFYDTAVVRDGKFAVLSTVNCPTDSTKWRLRSELSPA